MLSSESRSQPYLAGYTGRAAIAMGSNLGDRQANLNAALKAIAHIPDISIESRSHLYETVAVGPPQPDYLNACILVATRLTPHELLKTLLQIEIQLGRVRRERWGPRILDLDLLLFDDQIVRQSDLQIPHPRMNERAFVLVPLAEIAPHWVDPTSGLAIAQLLDAVDSSGVKQYSLISSNPMPLGQEPPQLLKQKLFYQGRKFNFEVNRLRLPNGAEGDWECIRHPGGALAVPITAEGKLVLVRQYRFASQGRLLEFPAGTVESHEDPVATIQREIEEETGYRAHQWHTLGQFFLAPGYSDEVIYAFLAQELEKLDTPPSQDDDEDIEVILLTPDELEEAILDGEPVDSKSISSLVLARPFLKQLQHS
jgi:ADP-ribose pyrophosphatase